MKFLDNIKLNYIPNKYFIIYLFIFLSISIAYLLIRFIISKYNNDHDNAKKLVGPILFLSWSWLIITMAIINRD